MAKDNIKIKRILRRRAGCMLRLRCERIRCSVAYNTTTFIVGPTIHQKGSKESRWIGIVVEHENELNMWCDRNLCTHINMTNYLHQLLSWFCLRWHFVSACNIVNDILPLKAHHQSSLWLDKVCVCEILCHLIAFLERMHCMKKWAKTFLCWKKIYLIVS